MTGIMVPCCRYQANLQSVNLKLQFSNTTTTDAKIIATAKLTVPSTTRYVGWVSTAIFVRIIVNHWQLLYTHQRWRSEYRGHSNESSEWHYQWPFSVFFIALVCAVLPFSRCHQIPTCPDIGSFDRNESQVTSEQAERLPALTIDFKYHNYPD